MAKYLFGIKLKDWEKANSDTAEELSKGRGVRYVPPQQPKETKKMKEVAKNE